ncbi:MAG: glycosyltransferase [Planctomycetales bacterium]|nr:glycosyltransferase [Planctomycetales bacterium]
MQFTPPANPADYVNPTVPVPPRNYDLEEIERPRADSKSRRVLHVINGEYYSGAERVQDLLAQCLPEFGYEVGFACIKPKLFPELRNCQSAPIYDASMKSMFDLGVVKRLARIVEQENYELIHAHTPRSAAIARLVSAKTRTPMVYHVHSPTARDSTNGWSNRAKVMIERVSLIGVKRLVAVSESLSSHMIRSGTDADHIVVVPNGVKCVENVPFHKEPSGTWTLGTVALFRPRKGTEFLLRAIAVLNKRNVSVKLRAVGGFESTEYEARLKGLAAELGIEDQVEWLGFCKDVDAEMNKLDLFVLPSIFGEGLPMVVLEAMACGIPVIGTDVEGIPEAIRDGIEGLIAKAADAESLADSIAAVIEGEFSWLELRQHCIDRQREMFSDRSMARGVADVYNTVLHVEPKDPADRGALGESATSNQVDEIHVLN